VNPLDHPVAFSYPLRIVDSAWLEHVPFGLFVVDILRPRTLVELGTYNGVSYCAFCQAVRELSSDTRCYAIDTWQGDPQSGFYGEEVLAGLREHHDPLYGSFSRLVQSTFDEAADHFDDGSIDLLHIDGYHTYDAVKHDWQTWLPKMSEQGVVLLHDTNVREGDFGAWKLWEEVAPGYRHFEFTHGHGLGVLLVGEEVSGQLSELLDAGSEDVSRIREFFYQLGRRVVLQQERQRSAEELATHLEATQSTIRALTAQTTEKDRVATELTAQMAEKDRVATELTAQIAGMDRALRTMQAKVTTYEDAGADLPRTRQELTVLSRERDSLSDRLERIESRLTFRALERVWQTQMRIAPPQTRHGKVWFGFTRFARRVIGQPPIPAKTGTLVLSGPPELRTHDDEQQYDAYVSWARHCEVVRFTPSKSERAIERFAYRPKISVVMPVYNPPVEYLRKAIDSVRQQYYPYWELCICDDASPGQEVRQILRQFASEDDRIQVAFSDTNGGIGIASNRALALAHGEFVGFVDHDDELTPDALYEVVSALQDTEADLLYSDEDKLNAAGQRCDPAFKPAWSPDLLLSCMYTLHFSVYRKTILEEIGGFREGFDGSQDHDLALRFTERTQRIIHIPKILYHWRQVPGSAAGDTSAKPYAYESARRALSDALQRRSVRGIVEAEPAPGFFRVKRRISTPGKVSIVIPTRDRLDLLQGCLEGIVSTTEYENYDILIVDNGSRDAATLEYLSQIPHRVVRDDGPFNFARLNNRAAREVDGEYLLLLNDDTRPMTSGWLSAMVEQVQRPEVGAAGAKLLFPDGRIQHAGVLLGLGGVGDHSHRYVDSRNGGYCNFPNIIRNYSAVTGACLMIRRDLYLEVGGMDEEHLPVNFNDVDLCLRLRQKGYLVVYTPYSVLQHRESATRTATVAPWEEAYMFEHWGDVLTRDPYYNPNMSLKDVSFTLDLAKPDSFFSMDWQSVTDAIVGPLYTGREVGQTYIPPRNELCAIGIFFATYGKTCHGTVRFRLRAAQALEDLHVVDVDASRIGDNQLYIFPFTPVPDSAGKQLIFSVDFTPSVSGSEITVWKSSATDETCGPYLETGSPAAGTLSFRSFTPARAIAPPMTRCEASEPRPDSDAHLAGI